MALWQAGDGSPWLVGVYLPAMAVLTLVALLIGKETKHLSLDSGEAASVTDAPAPPVTSPAS